MSSSLSEAKAMAGRLKSSANPEIKARFFIDICYSPTIEICLAQVLRSNAYKRGFRALLLESSWGNSGEQSHEIPTRSNNFEYGMFFNTNWRTNFLHSVCRHHIRPVRSEAGFHGSRTHDSSPLVLFLGLVSQPQPFFIAGPVDALGAASSELLTCDVGLVPSVRRDDQNAAALFQRVLINKK